MESDSSLSDSLEIQKSQNDQQEEYQQFILESNDYLSQE